MGLESFFGIKQKEEQTMQPTTTPTAPTGLPESSSEVQPQTTTVPVVQEPKKTPEIKTLDVPSNIPDENKSNPLRPEHRPHAFVIMPFGKKKGGDGSLYDFNAIYTQLIKPTLEGAGFESFRADE